MKRVYFFSFLILIFLLSFTSAYVRSNAQYTEFNPTFRSEVDKDWCKSGMDFVVQIAPFGCTPPVVRQDLLEEQNVPVFCQLAATQINPFIDVEAIDQLSFSGSQPKEVSGLGFYPAKAALGRFDKELPDPVLNNIGYLVIVLKKQPNGTAMPEQVKGQVTARIQYDLKNAFSLGRVSFYLPEFLEDDWQQSFNQYSFWNTRGYVRAESITEDGAKISIYAQNNINRPIRQFTLNEGQTSSAFSLPGYDCVSSFRARLDSLQNPTETARIRVGSDVVEVAKGETFLENACRVLDFSKRGLYQSVEIRCDEDGDRSTFTLSVDPKVKLQLCSSPEGTTKNGGCTEKEYGVGDILYTIPQSAGSNRALTVFVGYIGKIVQTDQYFVLPVVSTSTTKEQFLKSFESTSAETYGAYVENYWNAQIGNSFTNFFKKVVEFEADSFIRVFQSASIGFDYGTVIVQGQDLTQVTFSAQESVTGIQNVASASREFWNSIFSSRSEQAKLITYPQRYAQFVDIVGAQDFELSDSLSADERAYRTNYTAAVDNYDSLIRSYSSEEIPVDKNDLNKVLTKYGEQALYEKIVLAQKTGNQKQVLDLAKEFEENYPQSPLLSLVLQIKSQTSFYNAGVSVRDVLYRGKLVQFSFEGIYKPGREAFGAVVSTRGAKPEDNQNNVLLGKGDRIYFSSTEYAELLDLDTDKATFDTSSVKKASSKTIVDLRGSKALGEQNYLLRVDQINLQKMAKVSLIPDVNPSSTQVNFSYIVGIEKRAIQLSPDQTKKKVNDLNKQIAEWQKRSDSLGTVVSSMKAACLATGTVLVAKNFVTNTGGRAIARENVMRGEHGWYEVCAQYVNQKKYVSIDECLFREGDNIEKDVQTLGNYIEQQNKEIKSIQDPLKQPTGFGEQVVNDDQYIDQYAPRVSESLSKLGPIQNPKNPSESIDPRQVNPLIWDGDSSPGWNNSYYSKDQLRNTELYSRILQDSSASPELKKMAQQQLYNDLSEVQQISDDYTRRAQLASNLGIAPEQVPFVELNNDARTYGYYGKTVGQLKNQLPQNTPLSNADPSAPVQVFTGSNGQTYYAILERNPTDGRYFIAQTPQTNADTLPVPKVFDASGNLIPQNQIPAQVTNINFVSVDSEVTNLQCKPIRETDQVVRYYENEPYKGLPAQVPFDIKGGWYAATKQTLSGLGSIRAFDQSGRVVSFYLCNVGCNGAIDFNSGIGDDTCQLINLGTGQPYDQIPGVSKAKATQLVSKAVQSLEEAAKGYKDGARAVRVAGQSLKIAEPAVTIPQTQCQDYMSPQDCQLLFNVCDPVICPSSRCDFGGAYPVKDVIQSGIVGSLALCLPNIREGVYIPVCLSGVKAGIDGFLSVKKSYRDCLNESLNTGKTVGICDEIYSIHLCEFFWRQGIPLAQIALPKFIELALGQNTRGGGEYAGVQSAWENAQNSVTYFTQVYGANAYKAFQARSTEDVGGLVCKGFVSAVYPNEGLFDALTAPDSPPQFHGTFEEIPFTTVTVPATSQYKVFYHIFAGKDSRAYYQVYLKGDSGAFYQDTNGRRAVASGYIQQGGYASETKDFLAPSGLKQLCIVVNGQEECGFKQVTTSFGINYVTDAAVAAQAKEADITSEAACVSGTPNGAALLNLNPTAAAGELIDPAIYERGIIRVCSTQNPGKGTDPYAGTDQSRWKEVGFCGDQKLKCWLDSESVKDTIRAADIEQDTLSSQVERAQTIIRNDPNRGYLSKERVDDILLQARDTLRNAGGGTGNTIAPEHVSKVLGVIQSMDANYDRVFLNSERAQVILIRAQAHAMLARYHQSLATVALSATSGSTTPSSSSGSSSTSSSTTVFPEGWILRSSGENAWLLVLREKGELADFWFEIKDNSIYLQGGPNRITELRSDLIVGTVRSGKLDFNLFFGNTVKIAAFGQKVIDDVHVQMYGTQQNAVGLQDALIEFKEGYQVTLVSQNSGTITNP